MFNAENLPMTFFDDFYNIETDDVKQVIYDIVNVMYDDYTVEEVKRMFSTFQSTSYEIYLLLHYRSDYDEKFQEDIDFLAEVILYCTSQLTQY